MSEDNFELRKDSFKLCKRRGICMRTYNGRYYRLDAFGEEFMQFIVDYLNFGYFEWFNKKCMEELSNQKQKTKKEK